VEGGGGGAISAPKISEEWGRRMVGGGGWGGGGTDPGLPAAEGAGAVDAAVALAAAQAPHEPLAPARRALVLESPVLQFRPAVSRAAARPRLAAASSRRGRSGGVGMEGGVRRCEREGMGASPEGGGV
jgi:hypothetical protein